MKTKLRQHNEWFRPISLGNRKSCPTCKNKLKPREMIWSWGEYHNAKWRTVKHFCSQCFAEEVRKPLLEHTGDCGCTINLVVREAPQPEWLTLKTCEQVGAK